MAVCTECQKEYLDSYAVCPFCAKKWREADEARFPDAMPERRWRINPAIGATIAGAASLTGIIVYVILQLYFGSRVVDTAGNTGALQACYLNQGLVERAVLVRFTETQSPVTTLEVIFPDYVAAYPACPEDGTYSYVWDPNRPKFECSVHGWHGE